MRNDNKTDKRTSLSDLAKGILAAGVAIGGGVVSHGVDVYAAEET